MMELESDMVSIKRRYHKNEEKLTRQMGDNYFLPVLSGTDESAYLALMKVCTFPLFCVQTMEQNSWKYPTISSYFLQKYVVFL